MNRQEKENTASLLVVSQAARDLRRLGTLRVLRHVVGMIVPVVGNVVVDLGVVPVKISRVGIVLHNQRLILLYTNQYMRSSSNISEAIFVQLAFLPVPVVPRAVQCSRS